MKLSKLKKLIKENINLLNEQLGEPTYLGPGGNSFTIEFPVNISDINQQYVQNNEVNFGDIFYIVDANGNYFFDDIMAEKLALHNCASYGGGVMLGDLENAEGTTPNGEMISDQMGRWRKMFWIAYNEGLTDIPMGCMFWTNEDVNSGTCTYNGLDINYCTLTQWWNNYTVNQFLDLAIEANEGDGSWELDGNTGIAYPNIGGPGFDGGGTLEVPIPANNQGGFNCGSYAMSQGCAPVYEAIDETTYSCDDFIEFSQQEQDIVCYQCSPESYPEIAGDDLAISILQTPIPEELFNYCECCDSEDVVDIVEASCENFDQEISSNSPELEDFMGGLDDIDAFCTVCTQDPGSLNFQQESTGVIYADYCQCCDDGPDMMGKWTCGASTEANPNGVCTEMAGGQFMTLEECQDTGCGDACLGGDLVTVVDWSQTQMQTVENFCSRCELAREQTDSWASQNLPQGTNCSCCDQIDIDNYIDNVCQDGFEYNYETNNCEPIEPEGMGLPNINTPGAPQPKNYKLGGNDPQYLKDKEIFLKNYKQQAALREIQDIFRFKKLAGIKNGKPKRHS